MKINLEIDCTPEEARRFFGLPDLQPIQEAVLARMQQQMLDGIAAMSPEAMLRQWMPIGLSMMPQTPESMRDAMARMAAAFMARPGSQAGSEAGSADDGTRRE